MGETFLVCIHNISDSMPYAILRTSINNTSKDVIKQVRSKTNFSTQKHKFKMRRSYVKLNVMTIPTTMSSSKSAIMAKKRVVLLRQEIFLPLEMVIKLKKIAKNKWASIMSIMSIIASCLQDRKPTSRPNYSVLKPEENIW